MKQAKRSYKGLLLRAGRRYRYLIESDFLRRTRSGNLWKQSVGRALRPDREVIILEDIDSGVIEKFRKTHEDI